MLTHKLFDNSFLARGLAKDATWIEKHKVSFAFLGCFGAATTLLSSFPFPFLPSSCVIGFLIAGGVDNVTAVAAAATVGIVFVIAIITILFLNLSDAAAAVEVVAFPRRLRSRRASREGVRIVFFSGGPGLLLAASSRPSGPASPLNLILGILTEQLEKLVLRARVALDHGPAFFRFLLHPRDKVVGFVWERSSPGGRAGRLTQVHPELSFSGGYFEPWVVVFTAPTSGTSSAAGFGAGSAAGLAFTARVLRIFATSRAAPASVL